MVTDEPLNTALAVRATSGAQSRELLGAIDAHHRPTNTMGRIAATSPLKKGRTRVVRNRLLAATATHIAPASTRDLGPSNHRASAAQVTPATTITASTTVTVSRKVRPTITQFPRAHRGYDAPPRSSRP